MTPQVLLRIAIAAVAVLAVIAVAREVISDYKISRLERTTETQRHRGQEMEAKAAAMEVEAAGYVKKIEFLESRIEEIREIARKQDEEINSKTDITRRARADRERAVGKRSIEITVGELCGKLAELGKGCD